MWKYILILTIIFILVAACANIITSTTTNTPSFEFYFPQVTSHPSVFLEARLIGELILNNGCIQVKNDEGINILLIWRPGFSVRVENDVIQVLDSNGEVTASVGDFVAVGGGYTDNPESRGLAEPIPEECKGSYYLVGETIKKIDKP